MLVNTLIASISNHYQLDLKQSADFLLDEKRFLFNKNDPHDLTEENIITLLGSWKSHYNSWKIASNSIIIRYEDLVSNTKLEIENLSKFIKKFIKFEANEEKIQNILETTSFKKLKDMEKKEGFEEAANTNIKFFNLGPKNDWKKILDKKLKDNIEKNFENEMKELKYI